MRRQVRKTIGSGAVRGLLESAADWRLIDSLVVPTTIHGADGRFMHLNAAAERASGKSNAQRRGRPMTELLPPEVHGTVSAQFRRAMELGVPTDFETVFADESGPLRSVRVLQLPLRDGDAIVGALTLAFDVRATGVEPVGLPPAPHLTARERQILDLIAAGRSTAEIATELALSTETVRNYLRSVFRVLHAHTRIEAIVTAQRLGLLAAPGLGPADGVDPIGSTEPGTAPRQ